MKFELHGAEHSEQDIELLKILHTQVNKRTTTRLYETKKLANFNNFVQIAKEYRPAGTQVNDFNWSWLYENWLTPKQRGIL